MHHKKKDHFNEAKSEIKDDTMSELNKNILSFFILLKLLHARHTEVQRAFKYSSSTDRKDSQTQIKMQSKYAKFIHVQK